LESLAAGTTVPETVLRKTVDNLLRRLQWRDESAMAYELARAAMNLAARFTDRVHRGTAIGPTSVLVARCCPY